MDIWKISLDQDGSTATDLSEFSSSIYVNVGIPKVKYNALSVLGHQGDIDITAAYNGEVFYEPRECTVIIMSNSGANITASSVASALIDAYLGQRVRLQNITQDYMLIGRLTEAEYEELSNGKDYKIRFKLIAEPWRYETTETERGDIMPISTPSNQWATLTAGQEGTTETGFSSPASEEPPSIAIDIAPESEAAPPVYYRIVVSNLVNCTVSALLEDPMSGKMKLVDISQPILGAGTYTRFYLDITSIDDNAAVSGDVYVGTYPAIIYNNSGKSVPIKAWQKISTVSNDIYLVVNGISAKLKHSTVDYEFYEYPQLMLNNGTNYIMAYASDMAFDQSSLNPTWD